MLISLKDTTMITVIDPEGQSKSYEFVTDAAKPSEDFPFLCTYTIDGEFQFIYHGARSLKAMEKVLQYIAKTTPDGQIGSVYWWAEQAPE